jgi:hypothetical protein
VPFAEVRAEEGGERWSFLADRHLTAADGPTVLILRTLFGFDLWGNLAGLELRDRAPSFTADVPPGILISCAASRRFQHHPSFPEGFERASLVLIWEWFLLEVGGAVPPLGHGPGANSAVGETPHSRSGGLPSAGG